MEEVSLFPWFWFLPWERGAAVGPAAHPTALWPLCSLSQATHLLFLLLVPLTTPIQLIPPPYTLPSIYSPHLPSRYSPHLHSTGEKWPISAGRVIWELWEHRGYLGSWSTGAEQESFSGRRDGREFQAGEQFKSALMHPVYPGINCSFFEVVSRGELLNGVSEIKTCDTTVLPLHISHPILLSEYKYICHPGPRIQKVRQDEIVIQLLRSEP